MRLVDAKNGEVVNNLVGAVGLQAPNARCLGIQLLASNSVRLAGNDVGDIGPAEGGAQTSAGIEVIGTFDQLDVVNNHVRRSRSVSQVVDNADWYAVLINGARTQPPRLRGLNMFFAARTNTAFLLSANRILAQLLGREWVSLQGNFLEAYGVGAAVRAAVGGACTLQRQSLHAARPRTAGGGFGGRRRGGERQPSARHARQSRGPAQAARCRAVHGARQHYP